MTLDSSLADTALRHGIRPGLERITALLDMLGRPQDRHPVVHVAGTNGKGSVCAFLAAMLQEAGYRVGRYTSPHLVSYRERFRLDAATIPEAELESELARVTALADTLDPALGPTTEFELLTAVAFDWFARQPIDLLILEVGLGGRLDATNVIERPLVTAITRIARDHTALLGETPEAIAREKAGILKAGVPLVCGATGPALDAIRTCAREVGAPLRVANLPPEGGAPLGLLGEHQQQNAALALEVVQALREQGWSIPVAAARRGLAGASWPGRLERFETPARERFLADGAHNLDGAQALASFLGGHPEPGGRLLLFGVLADKDYRDMVELLAAHAGTVVLTRPPSARALSPEALGLSHADVHVESDWRRALNLARRLAAGREIVVAGSLYLVGALYGELGRSVS